MLQGGTGWASVPRQQEPEFPHGPQQRSSAFPPSPGSPRSPAGHCSSCSHLPEELLQRRPVRDVELLEEQGPLRDLLHPPQALGEPLGAWGTEGSEGLRQRGTARPGTGLSVPRMALWKLSMTTGTNPACSSSSTQWLPM